MGQYNQYQSLLGDTSVLHLAVSEEKTISNGFSRSAIRNNQGQRTCSPDERRCSALSKQSDGSDSRREVPSTPGYTVPQQRILKKEISLKAADRCALPD